jgi:hypothetical protein
MVERHPRAVLKLSIARVGGLDGLDAPGQHAVRIPADFMLVARWRAGDTCLRVAGYPIVPPRPEEGRVETRIPLDTGHVLPNMGDVTQRGVWFPPFQV